MAQIEDAIKYLNAYRNSHYNDPLTEDSYWLANAINDILPFAIKENRRTVPANPFPTPRTNFDAITECPEKLAKFICELPAGLQCPDDNMSCPKGKTCETCWLDWINRPAEEDTHHERNHGSSLEIV